MRYGVFRRMTLNGIAYLKLLDTFVTLDGALEYADAVRGDVFVQDLPDPA